MRRVISLWLPRFATERRRGHRGETRPLALLGEEGGRQILTAVDDAAAAAGLTPGLPLAEARAQVPDLRCAPADPAGDARALRRLAAWCQRYSPWTAPDQGHDSGGAAGVLIDSSGCAHLFGGEAEMLADLPRTLQRLGWSARAAMAGTPGAAWALARFATSVGRPTLVVPAGDERAALAPLPVAALRLGAAECDLLRRLGLRTVDDLLAIPSAALTPRTGRTVARRLDQALGRVAEPVDPLPPVAPPRVRRDFGEPIAAREALVAAVDALTADLCRKLAKAHAGVRRLELTLARVDGARQTLRLGTSRASRNPEHLQRLFAERLDELNAGFGVEAITLAATATEALAARQLALAPPKGGGKTGAHGLAALIDRLEARLGAGAVTRPCACESYLPERAVARVLPFVQVSTSWPSTPARPVRLFPRPQPVEAAAARAGDPPGHFLWRRLTHSVVAAEGPERIAPEWWRPGMHEGAATRDYFRVATADGRRTWLFQAAGRWHLHGVFA